MRTQASGKGIWARGIGGTHVVLLGMNATDKARKGLLGFAIHRTDHTEDEAYWLKGFRTFESVEPNPRPGTLVSTLEHPVQGFLWGDYTAKPDHRYTYRIVPMYGKPRRLREGHALEVDVQTESETDGTHSVWFNRGVAASQAYARRFGNRRPDEVPRGAAWKWLSRGLQEAMLAFIAQANGPGYSLRAAVYEFTHEPVLQAFRKALDAGSDVRILYDAKKSKTNYPVGKTEELAAKAGLSGTLVPRRANPSYIQHNKFIVLLKDGEPVQVWTGSTNFTDGGIFGHSNVGHVVRDAGVAKAYLGYWERLSKDPEAKSLRIGNDAAAGDLVELPPPGTVTVIASPRRDDDMLDWYASQLGNVQSMACFTAAFGVNAKLKAVLGKDRDPLRYILLERAGDDLRELEVDADNRVAYGSSFDPKMRLDRWLRERLTGLNTHVKYVHTKYMLLDALGDDPVVISGSANFSSASTTQNDENMLIVRGDRRLADIYIGEFMRLWNHWYARSIADRYRAEPGTSERQAAYLTEDDSWSLRYYQKGSVRWKERELFSGPRPTRPVVEIREKGKPVGSGAKAEKAKAR